MNSPCAQFGTMVNFNSKFEKAGWDYEEDQQTIDFHDKQKFIEHLEDSIVPDSSQNEIKSISEQ